MEQRAYSAYSMTDAATQRAIARCKKLHPRVKTLSRERNLFMVSGSRHNHYRVQLWPLAGERFIADCHCEAGKAGLRCYHAVAAYSAWQAVTSEYSREVVEKTAPTLSEQIAAAPLIKSQHKEVRYMGASI